MRSINRLFRSGGFVLVLAGFLAGPTHGVPTASRSLQVGDVSLPIWQRNDRTGAAKGSVLLVLGAGGAGAWPHSLATLSNSLPDHGWNTLAIRADIASPNLGDMNKRVNAALDLIEVQAGKPIVLVAAESLALSVAQQSVKQSFSKQPSAFVFLNRPGFMEEEQEQKFHQQQVAILELHNGLQASNELWRERRNLAAEYKQSFYQQINLPPAGPNWSGKPDRVVKKVTGWLKRSYK